MSDIFAGLNGGIKLPDVQMNVGPLPNTSGGPVGSDGTADGRYNFNSDLLSGIEPYAFGSSARMGSDRNYQQIPHRIQKIIPLLYLPYADDNVNDCLMPISHSVDQGDIAFVINSERTLSLLYDKNAMHDPSLYLRQTPAWSAFCNIVTVNYILAGLQRIPADGSKKKGAWALLANDLCYDWKKNNTPGKFDELLKLMQTRLIPFGICAGSENQGGLHETGLAPVQAAANHVTTMTVDGQNRDLVNYWSVHDLSAGDQLIMRLEFLPTSEYTLNHYYKQMATQRFNSKDSNDINCWQLVADRYSISYDPCLDLSQRYPVIEDKLTPCYDYRLDGYWRIGQLFQHRGKQNSGVKNFSDDMVFLKGQLLQITFAPVWLRMCEHGSRNGAYGSRGVKGGGDASKYKTDKSSGGRFSGHAKPGKRCAADLFDNAREDRLLGYNHKKQHKQHKKQKQSGGFLGDDDSDTDSNDSDWDGVGYGGGGYGGGGEGYRRGGSVHATTYKKNDDVRKQSITYSEWSLEYGPIAENLLNTYTLLRTSAYYQEYDKITSSDDIPIIGNLATKVVRTSRSCPDNFSTYYSKSEDGGGTKKKVTDLKGDYWILEEMLKAPILAIHNKFIEEDGLIQTFEKNSIMAADNEHKTKIFLETYKQPSGMTKDQAASYHQMVQESSNIAEFERQYAQTFKGVAGLLKDKTFIQRELELLVKEWIVTNEADESKALSSQIDKQSSGLKKKFLTLVGDSDKHAVQAKDFAEPAPKKVKVVKKMIKGKGDVEMKLGGNATDDTTTK